MAQNDITMDERFTNAFVAYLAGNKGPEGRPAEYGITASGNESTGVIKLTLVFKQGIRYCCAEWGCHIGITQPNDWGKLRRFLTESRIEIPTKILLHLKVVIEGGALLVSNSSICTPLESPGYEYEETLYEV